MRRITELFVRRPPLVFVLIVLIALAGGFSLATLVQQQFPNIDFPTINVSASYPGASPSELRDSVVRPIEDALAGAPDLDHLTSSVQQNQASISATFSLNSSETTDLTEVQDRLQSVKAALPQDIAAPSVRSFDPAQTTIVTLSLSSTSLSTGQLSAIVTNDVIPALEQVPGVSSASANGTVTPALEVVLDSDRLTGLGFTSTDVVGAIQANNARTPGGYVYGGGRETSLDVRGDVRTPRSIEETLLASNTAVLHGATSTSGAVTVRYGNTSGPTNQALALGSGGAASVVSGSGFAAGAGPGAGMGTAPLETATAPAGGATVGSGGTGAAGGARAVAIGNGGSGAASSGAGATTTEPFSTAAFLPRIGDVAHVVDGFQPKRVASYVDGKNAISVNVAKAAGASEVSSSIAVLAALPAIEAKYPAIAFRVLDVQADRTRAELLGVLQTLIEGVVFTGIAMLFFLQSRRNAIVVMIAIPTSLFTTFFAMKLAGFTIDTISLLAMTLIVGILVDDSIVVLENVERHRERGEPPRLAAILGRAEIGAAAVVITLVDVVVFLPIAFLPGQTGRFLAEFGVVVTIATLTSLAVSFTITPALAGNWSLLSTWRAPRPIVAFTHAFARLREIYVRRVLGGAFRRPRTVVAVAALLTAGAIALIPLGYIGFEFIPAVDGGQIFARVQYPTGTPLAKTDATIRKLTAAFLRDPDVDRVVSTSGTYRGGFGGGVNVGSAGQLQVLLLAHRTRQTADVAKALTAVARRVAPDAKTVAVPATGTRGGNAQPIDLTISATRGEPDAYVPQIVAALQATPGAVNVNSSALDLAPQFDVLFDRDRARVLDVNIGLAAQAIRAAFGGTQATQFATANGTEYVQVLYPQSADTSIRTLMNLPIRSASGKIVHLGDIAALKNAPTGVLLTRDSRQTVVHVGANLAPGAALSLVQADFRKRLAALHLPDTVVVGTGSGGAQQNLAQTVRGLGVSLVVSFGLVYLLMIALYNAYRAPLVIMFAVPVAAIGAFGGLALTHQSLNLFSLIGVVMLIGLVSKNGILLVDFAVLKVEAGIEKRAAITEAARERFRPIVMTTVSMIAGMLPLALALDPGSAAKRSLGTVVIGGLASSLVLTLVIVPIVFTWIVPGPPRPAVAAVPRESSACG